MNDKNQEPTKWHAFLSNHVFTLVNNEEEAEMVKGVARAAGVDESQLKIYKGVQGYIELDPQGEFHGLKGKLLRALQHLGEELPTIRHFAECVQRGEICLAIPYHGEDQREEILQALCESSAHDIVYTTLGNFYDHIRRPSKLSNNL